MKTENFQAVDPDFFEKCTEYIRSSIREYNINPKEIHKTELVCEEILVLMKSHIGEDVTVTVKVRRFFSDVVVEIEAEGSEFGCLKHGDIDCAVHIVEEESEEAIRTLVLKAYGEGLKYIHKDGVNRVRIQTQKREHSTVYATLLALAAAVAAGFLCRCFLPSEINDDISRYFLSPCRTMFINALKIVVGPVVFFSIVTCISQFSSLSQLGKLGAKVMGMYIFTTIIAVFVGLGMFSFINPGTWGMALGGSVKNVEVSVNADVETSILGTIVNIVPSNLFKPFVESDTLQIIFLAVLLGSAVGMIGRYTKVLQEILEACNELFLTVTAIISKFIPIAVFCAVTLMIIQIGSDSLLAMISMAGTEVSSLFVMMIVYGILLPIFGRLNPIRFYQKDWPGMLASFSLGSSSAAMPSNMRLCMDSFGVSQKLCGFSIPLGATVNMDGTSIHLALTTMFLAKVYGVDVPSSAMLSIIITILMLSIGTPGVPGASIVCLGILLNQIGVPIEAVGLIMGVDSLLDMLRTVSNTTGDIAVTLIVAKSEGLIDMETYNSR